MRTEERERRRSAHSPGTKEILYPLKGRVGAVVDGEAFESVSGHALFLETDVPHVYYCADKQPVRFRMVVVEQPASVNWIGAHAGR